MNIEISDKSTIDRHFPQLEHLFVDIYKDDEPIRITEADVEKVLTKNPQIRSLKLINSSQRLLHIIGKILPNLESLELMRYNDTNDSNDEEIVLLENVKIFTIFSGFGGNISRIHFKNHKYSLRFQNIGGLILPTEMRIWIDCILKWVVLILKHLRHSYRRN